jgi:hypothetical protein
VVRMLAFVVFLLESLRGEVPQSSANFNSWTGGLSNGLDSWKHCT